jgi:hypothetical protein
VHAGERSSEVSEREYWTRIAECYREAFGDRLFGVAVFGSRARGTARRDSDHDILLIVKDLPNQPFERSREIRAPLMRLRASGLGATNVQVLARTPEAFLSDVTSLHLDLGLDAIVLWERDSFLTRNLERLRALIQEAGLYRTPKLFWHWKRPPVRDWSITWQGVRV